MRKLFGGLIIATLAMIFALQNADHVPVHLFFWKIKNTSLAIVLFSTFVLGMVTGLLLLTPHLFKKNQKASEEKPTKANQ